MKPVPLSPHDRAVIIEALAAALLAAYKADLQASGCDQQPSQPKAA